jgi:hypothetical protein
VAAAATAATWSGPDAAFSFVVDSACAGVCITQLYRCGETVPSRFEVERRQVGAVLLCRV